MLKQTWGYFEHVVALELDTKWFSSCLRRSLSFVLLKDEVTLLGSALRMSNLNFLLYSGKDAEDIKESVQVESKPKLDVRLTDLKLVLGPELRIVYPLILNFAVSGELELNGVAHPKSIKPKGILMFENGDVNLVATQVKLLTSF